MAATTNALKYPWGVTPMPASASASPSAAPTADTAATPGSSDPPIALLVGLIVGLILLVIGIVVVVYVVRAKCGKKATSGTQGAAPATQPFSRERGRGALRSSGTECARPCSDCTVHPGRFFHRASFGLVDFSAADAA